MSHSWFFFFFWCFLKSGLRRKPLDIVWRLWRWESRPWPKTAWFRGEIYFRAIFTRLRRNRFPICQVTFQPCTMMEWNRVTICGILFYLFFCFFLDKFHHHMSRTRSLSSFHWEFRISWLFSFYVWQYSSSVISIMIASDPSIPNSLRENAPSHKLDFGNYLNIAIFLLFGFSPQRFMLSSACRKHSLIVGFLFSQNLISQSANCPHRYF